MQNLATGTLVLTLVAGLALACSSNTPAAPENTGGNSNNAGAAGANNAGAAGANNAGAAGASDDAGAGGKQGLDATTKTPYPAGPYGWEKGSTVPNLKWYGWLNPQEANYDPNAMTTIQFSDFYDPDGKKTKAIFLNASAVWCTVCRGEQSKIRNELATWGPKGVAFMETIFEDAQQGPSTRQDLVYWAKTFKVTWPLLLDPGNKLSAMFDVNATPMNAIIDPRTMKIVSVITGVPDDSWWTTTLDPLVGSGN